MEPFFTPGAGRGREGARSAEAEGVLDGCGDRWARLKWGKIRNKALHTPALGGERWITPLHIGGGEAKGDTLREAFWTPELASDKRMGERGSSKSRGSQRMYIPYQLSMPYMYSNFY